MPTIINGTTGIDRVQPGVIVAEDIAANAVTTAKILDANITAAKMSGAQTGSAPVYGCRAWVNFDGTGAISANQTIRASGNVTSVFKNATGDYTITFTTAMPDANYATVGMGDTSATFGDPHVDTVLAGSVRIKCNDWNSSSLSNGANISIAIFR